MKKISFEEIVAELTKERNIAIIEDILSGKAREVLELQILKDNQINFKDKEKFSKEKLALEVMSKVNQFLNIDKISMPKIIIYEGFMKNLLNIFIDKENSSRNSEYDPFSKIIYLGVNCWKERSFIPELAHEYTHHVHIKLNSDYTFFSCYEILEGVARGVERHISYEYQKEKKDDLFIYDCVNIDYNELKTIYSWISKIKSRKPKKDLIKIKTPHKFNVKPEYQRNQFNQKILTEKHIIGNAFLYIQEILYGKDIYKDYLKFKK